jgi:hypothetical protein
MYVKLSHRRRAMRLDCLHADVQQVRDTLVALSLGDEADDFALPRGQDLE